jgi:hypothetical protein
LDQSPFKAAPPPVPIPQNYGRRGFKQVFLSGKPEDLTNKDKDSNGSDVPPFRKDWEDDKKAGLNPAFFILE